MDGDTIEQALGTISRAISPQRPGEGLGLSVRRLEATISSLQQLEDDCRRTVWLRPVLETYRPDFEGFAAEDRVRFAHGFPTLWDSARFGRSDDRRGEWLRAVRNDVYIALALCLCLSARDLQRIGLMQLMKLPQDLQKYREHVLPYLLHDPVVSGVVLRLRNEIDPTMTDETGVELDPIVGREKALFEFTDGMSTSPKMFNHPLTKIIMHSLLPVADGNRETPSTRTPTSVASPSPVETPARAYGRCPTGASI